MKQGLSISEYGVKTVETGDVFTTRDEAELYEFLGYQYIPPSSARTSASSTRRARASSRSWSR